MGIEAASGWEGNVRWTRRNAGQVGKVGCVVNYGLLTPVSGNIFDVWNCECSYVRIPGDAKKCVEKDVSVTCVL